MRQVILSKFLLLPALGGISHTFPAYHGPAFLEFASCSHESGIAGSHLARLSWIRGYAEHTDVQGDESPIIPISAQVGGYAEWQMIMEQQCKLAGNSICPYNEGMLRITLLDNWNFDWRVSILVLMQVQ